MASSTPKSQTCPICKTPVTPSPRYPAYLCPACSDKAADTNGRALAFYNVSLSGGFEARNKDDGSLAAEVTESHIAFVDGVRVWVDEARFGGIVLTALPEETGKP